VKPKKTGMRSRTVKQHKKLLARTTEASHGITVRYSRTNQAWLVMWHDQILRVLPSEAAAVAYARSLSSKTSNDPGRSSPGYDRHRPGIVWGYQWQGPRFGYVKVRSRKKHLTAAQRGRLRPSQFALPARRQLPLVDRAHVKNAAARLTQMYRRGTVTLSEYKAARKKILAAEKRLGPGIFGRGTPGPAARPTRKRSTRTKRTDRDPGKKRRLLHVPTFHRRSSRVEGKTYWVIVNERNGRIVGRFDTEFAARQTMRLLPATKGNFTIYRAGNFR